MSLFDESDRDRLVALLGYEDYEDFLASDFWELIAEEVLRRDKSRCRCKGCGELTNLARPINYAPRTLLGIGAHCVVAVCTKCEAEYPTPELLAERVVGTKPRPGVSNPRIGFWYRDQARLNRQVSGRVVKRVYRDFPDVYRSRAFVDALTE